MTPVRWLLACALLTAGPMWSAETPHESLLVLSKGDHTVAIVDASTLKVIAKAPVGEDPHEVVASSDGRSAYVSNYGGGAYNTLTLIDLIGQKRVKTIDLGPLHGPHGLAFMGGKAWFTAEAAKAIGSYDPAADRVDWILGTGQDGTHMIFVTPGMDRVYTTNIGSATVSVMEKSSRTAGGRTRTDWEQTVIPVGTRAEGFDVTPDGRELWAANAGDGTVSVIDLAAKKVTGTLQADVRGANRLKFTPDGKLVFISSLGGKGITILDAATRKQVKRIDMPKGASGIEMQPDGSRPFVACTGHNFVAVIDLKSLEITGRIDAGRNRMGWRGRCGGRGLRGCEPLLKNTQLPVEVITATMAPLLTRDYPGRRYCRNVG